MTARRIFAAVAAVAACALAQVSSAPAHQSIASGTEATAGAGAAAAPQTCPGREIQPDRVITGEFGIELQGSYVMLPFHVPRGTTAVRVKYCFDEPDVPVSTSAFSARHSLDLGLYGPRRDRSKSWGMREFRGWGGSSHPDVTVSAEGFSTEEQFLAKPRVEPPGKTTRAFVPGRIEPGEWAVELGVAAVAPRSVGDFDEKVAWRVEIELADDPAFADEPYVPARYDTSPASGRGGWYAGDVHVHAEHSAYTVGRATIAETLDYAYRPLGQGGAGLDFITLSDYITSSSWGEVGRHQRRHPGKLVIRSAEVITYRGHLNNHNTARLVDYRDGDIFEWRGSEPLRLLRGRRAASEAFGDIKRAGGFTQINHPTFFPSSVPAFALLCRGCPWDYSPEETGYDRTDAIEIATGPSGVRTDSGTQGPNPFTVTAIDFYERALARGHKIAAVGSSDSQHAGRTPNGATQAPVGEATTVVRAEELSSAGIECGVEAGHTYVKLTGNAGPDLRFEARPPGYTGAPATMGDTVRADSAAFTVRVTGGDGRALTVYRNGELFRTIPVSGPDFSTSFDAAGHGRYRLQLQRGNTIETVSTPIYLEPGRGTVQSRDCSPLRVRGKARRRVRPGRRGAFPVRCVASGGGLRFCTVQVETRVGKAGRKRLRVIGRRHVRMAPGTRRMRVRLSRLGRRVVGRHPQGRRVRLVFIASDGDGDSVRFVRRARLVRPAGRG